MNSSMESSEIIEYSSFSIDLLDDEDLVPDYSTSPQASNAFTHVLGSDNSNGDELVALNANELEKILSNPGKSFSLLEEFGNLASYENFSQHFGQDYPHQFQPSMEVTLNTENQPEVANKQKKRAEKQNLLVISVPKEMQGNSTLQSLPIIQLESESVLKINAAASGHAGVFIPPSNNDRPNKIRRPPLQVIQRFTQPKVEPKAEPISGTLRPHKRKQRFEVTRDDSLMFFGDSSQGSVESLPPSPSSDSFKFLVNDNKLAETIAAAIDSDPNRCPGCKKYFKKLSIHKCKKSLSSDLDRGMKVELLCSICDETFTHRVDFYEHTKSHIMMFCACCEQAFLNLDDLKIHLMKCGVTSPVGVENKDQKRRKLQVAKTENSEVSKKNTKVVTNSVTQVAVEASLPVIDSKKPRKRTAQDAKEMVPKPEKQADVKKGMKTFADAKQEFNGKTKDKSDKNAEQPAPKKAKIQVNVLPLKRKTRSCDKESKRTIRPVRKM